jgi:hypothetical protein
LRLPNLYACLGNRDKGAARLRRGSGKQYQKLEALLLSAKRAEHLRNTSKQRAGLGSTFDFF